MCRLKGVGHPHATGVVNPKVTLWSSRNRNGKVRVWPGQKMAFGTPPAGVLGFGGPRGAPYKTNARPALHQRIRYTCNKLVPVWPWELRW